MKTISWKELAGVLGGIAIVAVVRGPSLGLFVFAVLFTAYVVIRDLRRRKHK